MREKADMNGPDAAVTRSMYPEMTVISATPILKSSAIVTNAGDRRGASTEAYRTDPYEMTTIITSFFAVDQFNGSLGSSELGE